MHGNRLRLSIVLTTAAAALALVAASVADAGVAAARAGGSWSSTAAEIHGSSGARATYSCPGGGQAYSVWGTDVYTDDSSVCTAAVHAGLISFADGGSVTFEIRPGQGSYTGSTRNGVTTKSYGSWSSSFVFVSGSAGAGGGGAVGGSTWSADAKSLRGNIGKRYAYTCPAGGQPSTVWGSGPYTDDSSVCTAGVHAGVIGFASGGTVTIQIAAGASSYTGTTRNGVTTKPYGSWGGSFTVVGAQSAGGGTTGTQGATTVAGTGWASDVRRFRGQVGTRFVFTCPANGRPSTVWGTGYYTDDSSVCTAAVHSGLITFARGGTVTVEMRPGLARYTGSTRNGVTTKPYGSWPGTFVIVRATRG